jgi:hypothetical protein
MTAPGPTEKTTADTPTQAEATDPLDEDLTKAVERSYAKRLATGTSLSKDERRRIQNKQRSRQSDDGASTED